MNGKLETSDMQRASKSATLFFGRAASFLSGSGGHLSDLGQFSYWQLGMTRKTENWKSGQGSCWKQSSSLKHTTQFTVQMKKLRSQGDIFLNTCLFFSWIQSQASIFQQDIQKGFITNRFASSFFLKLWSWFANSEIRIKTFFGFLSQGMETITSV